MFGRSGLLLGALLTLLALSPGVSDAGTLDKVKERGSVQCGVNRSGQGLSSVNAAGEWTGFFVDFCRAVAAATLKAASAVEFVELNQRTRFDATRDGAVDLFSANTTWTLTRDAAMGLQFAVTLYYDGKAVGSGRVEQTQPMGYSADEACDVGSDTGTPVDDRDYQVPFVYRGHH